jgi:hypothetical protein
VPPAANTSAGQVALVPEQTSGGSQTSPDPARQTVVDGANPFAGHWVPPLHVSATSQTPAALRHTVPLATRWSAGHVALVPVHVSATSHAPALARHTVPDD